MFKKIKYFIYFILILLFIFLNLKFYSSDSNKKNSYRSYNNIDKKIKIYAEKLPILDDDTKDIIEYVEQSNSKKKKKFNFCKLLDTNE